MKPRCAADLECGREGLRLARSCRKASTLELRSVGEHGPKQRLRAGVAATQQRQQPLRSSASSASGRLATLDGSEAPLQHQVQNLVKNNRRGPNAKEAERDDREEWAVQDVLEAMFAAGVKEVDTEAALQMAVRPLECDTPVLLHCRTFAMPGGRLGCHCVHADIFVHAAETGKSRAHQNCGRCDTQRHDWKLLQHTLQSAVPKVRNARKSIWPGVLTD